MDPSKQAALNTARTNVEMAQGISRGVPPTNPQIANVLEGTERALHSQTIPAASQKVGHDAAVLVGDLKTVFLEKNKDENIQGLIRDMGTLATTSAQQVSAKAGPGGVSGLVSRAKGLVKGQEAQGTLQQGTESIKMLVKALVRNEEFRSGLKDLFATLQWAFYQRSNKVKSNVDQHWSSDQFYTYYATPAFGSTFSQTTTTTTTAAPTFGVGTIQPLPTVQQTTTTAPFTASSTYTAPGTVLQPPLQTTYLRQEPLPHPPRAPQTDFERKLANQVPMTDVERAELRLRLITALLKLNRTQELRDASTNFLEVITWIKSQSLIPATSTSGAKSQALPTTGPGVVAAAGVVGTQPVMSTMTPKTPDFRSVMKRFQRLVEEFTGNKSLDDLVFYAKEFFMLMKNDENLRTVLADSATWGQDFFKAGYATQEAIPATEIQRLDLLLQRLDHTFVGLANHYVIWRLLEEIQQVSNAIRDDPFRNKLAMDTRVFVEDFLYYDQMGRPQLNTQVMSQLKYLLLPILKEQLAYIPLPRIESSDEKMDYWVENVVLTTSDILPDNVKLDVRSKTLLNRPGLSSNAVNVIRLTLDNVRVHLKDVRFWYRKKTFPKMTDEGFVDFFLTRNGLRVTLEILTNFGAERDIFTMNKVRVSADRLKVKIHDSKHDFLYSILLAFFAGRMKREIEYKSEEAIRTNFSRLNASLSHIVHTAGQKRSAATSSLGSKTSAPIASALDTFVHPSASH